MISENAKLSWYRKALKKIDGFLSEIDVYLEVRVVAVEVNPLPEEDRGEGSYDTLSLSFSHRADPRIGWNMEIEHSDEYLRDKLRGVVAEVFSQTLHDLGYFDDLKDE